jgi:hypothetical protein
VLVFVDESGDAGFKFDKNSSRFFVVALVVFADNDSAARASQAVMKFKQTLKQRDEFKFSKMSQSRRQQFALFLRDLDFQARVFVVDKTQLSLAQTDMYQLMLASAFTAFETELENLKIRLDGTYDRYFRKSFKSHLRQMLGRKIADFTFGDSESSHLLQVADFVAGVVGRAEKLEDEAGLLELLHEKIVVRYQNKSHNP